MSDALRQREAAQVGIMERLWSGSREDAFKKPEDRPFNPLQMDFGERGGGVLGALGYALGTLGGIPKVVAARLFQAIDPEDPSGAFSAFKTIQDESAWFRYEKSQSFRDASERAKQYNWLQRIVGGVLASNTIFIGASNPFQDNGLNNAIAKRGIKANLLDLAKGRQFDDTDNRFSDNTLFYDRTMRYVQQGKPGMDIRDVSRIIAGKVWDNFTNPGEFLTDALVVDRVLKPIVSKALKPIVSRARKLGTVLKVAEATSSTIDDVARNLEDVAVYGADSVNPATGAKWVDEVNPARLALPGADDAVMKARTVAMNRANRAAIESKARAAREAERLLNLDAVKRANMARNQGIRVAQKQALQAAEEVAPSAVKLKESTVRAINFQGIPVDDIGNLVTDFTNKFERNPLKRTAAQKMFDSAGKQGTEAAAKNLAEMTALRKANEAIVNYEVPVKYAFPFYDYFANNDMAAKLVNEVGDVIPVKTAALDNWAKAAPVIDVKFTPVDGVDLKTPVMRAGKPTRKLKVIKRLSETEYANWTLEALGKDAWDTMALPNSPAVKVDLRPQLPQGALPPKLPILGSVEDNVISGDVWRKSVESVNQLARTPVVDVASPEQGQRLLTGLTSPEFKSLPPAKQIASATEAARLGFTPEILNSLSPSQRAMVVRFTEDAGSLVSTAKQALPDVVEPASAFKTAQDLLGNPNIVEPQKLLNSTGELVLRADGSVAIELAEQGGALVLDTSGKITRVASDAAELAEPRLLMDASLYDPTTLLTGSPSDLVLKGKQEAVAALTGVAEPKLLTGVVDDVLTVSMADLNQSIANRILISDDVSYTMFDNGLPKLLPPSKATGDIVDTVSEAYRGIRDNLRRNYYLLSNKPQLVNDAKAIIGRMVSGSPIDAETVSRGIKEALDDTITNNVWDNISDTYAVASSSATNQMYRVINDDNFGAVRQAPFKLLGAGEEPLTRLALPASKLSDLERQLDTLSRSISLPISHYLVPDVNAVAIVNSASETLGRIIDGKLVPAAMTDVADLTLGELRLLPSATSETVANLIDASVDGLPKSVTIDTTAKLADNYQIDIMVPEVEKMLNPQKLDVGTARIPGDRLKRSMGTQIPAMAVRSDGSLVVSVSSLASDTLDALPFNTGVELGVPTKLGLLTTKELNALPRRILSTIVDNLSEAKANILLTLQTLGDKELYDFLPFKSSVSYDAVGKMLDIDSTLIPDVVELKPRVVKPGAVLGMHGTSVDEWVPTRNPYTESIGDLGFGTYLTDSLDEARAYAAKVADETLSSEVYPSNFSNVHRVTSTAPLNVVDATKTFGSAPLLTWFQDALGLDVSQLPRKFTTGKAHSIGQWYKEILSAGMSEDNMRQYLNGMDEFLKRNGIDAVRSKALGFTKVLNVEKVTSDIIESTMDAIGDKDSLVGNLVNNYALATKTAYNNPIAFSRAINAKLDVLRNVYETLDTVTKEGFENLYEKATRSFDDVPSNNLDNAFKANEAALNEADSMLSEIPAKLGTNPCDL